MRFIRTGVAAIGLLWLAACTEMPTVRSFQPSSQAKVSSARHWIYIARDVAASIHVTADTRCVVIKGTDSPTPTPFQTFLAKAVRADLLDIKNEANGLPGSGKVARNTTPPDSAFSTLAIYETAPANLTCDSINIDATVVPHSGPAAYPYPGQFTLLATGIIVVRNVVRAFSEASAVGAVALAESAWWATSGFRTSHDATEITVTISRTKHNTEYLDQYVNVYYVASGDAALYEGPPPSRRFEVDRDDISACEKSPLPFVVSGDHLAEQKESYYLGSIQASDVSPAGTSLEGPRKVTFPITPATFERDPVTLTMIASDNSVRRAYLVTRSDVTHCVDKGVVKSPKSQFIVTPDKISACDDKAQFRVTAPSVAPRAEDYSFGVLPAKSAGTPQSGALGENIPVNFTGLQSANRGRDRVEFTMSTDDGATHVAYINVEGTPPACTPSKTAPKTTGKKKTNATAITLAPPGGQPADPSDLCAKPPLQIVVKGDGATNIQSADILGGEYPAVVDKRSDGKSTAVTLIFAKVPDFKSAIPDDHILHVNLSLTGTKAGGANAVNKLTLDRPVRCGAAP